MARHPGSPILVQLRTATTHAEQIAALNALKNDIVGHVQRKESWIGHGVLEPVVRVLIPPTSAAKLNGKDARFQLASRPLSDDDAVKLQALQLVTSFANGGASFLPPLHAARTLPAILANISPFTNTPQIVVAALKALTEIAAAAVLAPSSCSLNVQTLADSLFSSQHIESLNAILSISSPHHISQSQVTLAASLICRLCREDRHQQALATAGILDSLATRLASFAVRKGHVVPGADALARHDGLFDFFPEPAPTSAKLGPILDAIGVILGDSKYRAYRLVSSPSILAVFPSVRCDPSTGYLDHRQDSDPTEISSSWRKPLTATAMEYLLPAVPIAASRSTSGSPLPVLDLTDLQASSRTAKKYGSPSIWDTYRKQSDTEDIECPLLPWLTHLMRTEADFDRLMAASVLAALVKADLGDKVIREASIGLLVVPLLVNMMAKADGELVHKMMQADEGVDLERLGEVSQQAALERAVILERAPAILARLLTDNTQLQKAAFDCNAIKVLSRLLKLAYKPVRQLTPVPLWSPNADIGMDVESHSPVSQMGEPGSSPVLLRRIRLRESTLKALGALATGQEDYRKAIAAEDVIAYIVESLAEFPRKPRQFKERSKDSTGNDTTPAQPTPGYGTNPVSVIIAGCQVIRSLSRSVGILRTDIVDYAVALPILRFMTHPDINLQIAATVTMCNLLRDSSPVRELLTGAGVMRILCDHARSDNSALRVNAMWALKHFVESVELDLKKACLDQLEPGWLVQLIRDDPQDPAVQDARMKGGSEDVDEDVDMQASGGPIRWIYGSNGSLREFDASKSSRLRRAEDKLAAVRESELSPARRAHNDDVAIQEQGLGFIQNLLVCRSVGPSEDTTADVTDMIDYLFSEIGQDRLFDILTSKVRPRVLHPFSRRTPVAGREARVVHPPARVVVGVVFILVHLAASSPRHRQLVVAQTELLRALVQQSANREPQVRVGLCHLVTNLTEQEEGEDLQSFVLRAQELKKLGYLAKMESLKQNDRDLDVRERAKTAAWQMDQAVG